MTFAHGSDTYTFVASVGKHGKLTAKVDHPVTKVIPSLRRRLDDLGVGRRRRLRAPRSPARSGEGEGGSSGQGEADD